MEPTQNSPLRCDCCNVQIGYFDGIDLVIWNRHHGERHETRIPLGPVVIHTEVEVKTATTEGMKLTPDSIFYEY